MEVRGSDKPEVKEQAAIDFAAGNIRVLISKPLIFGMGLNFQLCHKMAFVGLSDSFEQYYQAVRRSWRFGQTMPVDVHIITADTEGAVVDNIQRKIPVGTPAKKSALPVGKNSPPMPWKSCGKTSCKGWQMKKSG